VQETYPETEAILEGLCRVSSLDVALLSNTCLEHWSKITSLSWMKYVNYAFASHELGTAKPEKQIFDAVESVRGILPHQILYFDDTDTNAPASIEFGWHSMLVVPSTNPGQQICKELSLWSIAIQRL
jgi:HAD superfamily hydrolase (TIGR01509 family)